MRGQSGMPGNEYADGMIEHDGDVGKLLKAIDDLGIADNTIVVYSTDNGPNQFSWPDAATTPFRSEKDTNWEGAFRVPAMVRWPGHIKPGEVSNEMFSGLDWFPTLLAAAGNPDVKETAQRLRRGRTNIQSASRWLQSASLSDGPTAEGRAHRVRVLRRRRRVGRVPTRELEGCVLRDEKPGGFAVWYDTLYVPAHSQTLQSAHGPHERADIVSDQYDDWRVKNAYLMGWMTFHATDFLETFIDYPPSQTPASFTIDQVEKDVEAKIRAMAKTPAGD